MEKNIIQSGLKYRIKTRSAKCFFYTLRKYLFSDLQPKRLALNNN